ncbi:hypothetical protein FB451DRAFT_593363 [Mycena latifolia]|nr:hypothetical protein FB451DRAFT_593363 [Mycena latifolia]
MYSLQIPSELLHAIVGAVKDHSALLNLRLASKTCNSIASPWAFRVLTVTDSVESAEGLTCLQNCDKLITNAVQEVVFKGDPEGLSNVYGYIDETSGEEGRDALSAAFSGLHKFPNLTTLRLDFHACFLEEDTVDVPENPSHFLCLQLALFAALAANPCPALVSLTLNNVIAMPDDIYTTETFQRFFRPLERLHLSVLSDTDGEGAYYLEPLNDFWEKSLAHILRSAHYVTTLTLRSDQPIGFSLSLDTVHLPRLADLSLHNLIIADTTAGADIAEFIVRHGATLARLELDACSVFREDAGVTRPWHAVLRRFKEELPHLRSFQLTPLPPGYIELDPGHYYMEITETVGPEADDSAALQSLMAVLEARDSVNL